MGRIGARGERERGARREREERRGQRKGQRREERGERRGERGSATVTWRRRALLKALQTDMMFLEPLILIATSVMPKHWHIFQSGQEHLVPEPVRSER